MLVPRRDCLNILRLVAGTEARTGGAEEIAGSFWAPPFGPFLIVVFVIVEECIPNCGPLIYFRDPRPSCDRSS